MKRKDWNVKGTARLPALNVCSFPKYHSYFAFRGATNNAKSNGYAAINNKNGGFEDENDSDEDKSDDGEFEEVALSEDFSDFSDDSDAQVIHQP